MTDPTNDCEDAREAADMGEKPDLGHQADTLIEALDGTDQGSDTRAGSLRGGSASGSEVDPDQDAINHALAEEGEALADADAGPDGEPDRAGHEGDPVEGRPD